MQKPVWDSKSSNNLDTNFDCYIAEALLSEGRYISTLENTLTKYQAATIDDLAVKQQDRLKELPKLAKLFYEIEMPLIKVLWQMEQKGILLDTNQLAKVGQNIDHLIDQVQKEISRETGDININSSVQLGNFLAEKSGIPLGKTKTGKYATNESELTKFKDQFPIIVRLLTYRELTKLRSTYIETLIKKADQEGRVHTTYNQIFVNTGRIASSNPNLQNIPVTSEIGQQIKSCFKASSGHVLVSFDYSQQELRVLAHLTQEKALINAFENNKDVHILTASKLFNSQYEQVSKQQRAVGKTINFGIIYGMSSYGMSEGLHIPREDAEQFIRQFYLSYPNIKSYFDNYLKNAAVNGFVETMLGRRRYVFEYPKQKFIDNSLRRVLLNYPIQGTAADLMKKSMVDINAKILTKHPEVSLLLTIHDDLVFEIPENDNLSKIIKEIQTVLCTVYPLSVPLEVDVKTGRRWGDLQKHKS
jgi:DNA polymerase-1